MQGPSFADLPHELLVRCLAPLEPRQRLGPAALVCKRFAAAACSPELLRDLDLGQVKGPAAVHSLAAWLERHSAHLRRLKLNCCSRNADEEEPAAAAIPARLAAAVQLVELTYRGSLPDSTEWLAALCSLRRLELNRGWSDELSQSLQIAPAINGLTALETLRLWGNFSLASGARLPTGLTRLMLSSLNPADEEETALCAGLLAQVAQLPRLAWLEFEYTDYSDRMPNMLTVLSRLSGCLTRLDLEYAAVPPSLSLLTQLQHLSILHDGAYPHDSHQAVCPALPHLTQLTCLVLNVVDMDMQTTCAAHAALPSLPHLQRCYLYSMDVDRLPPGPWLRNLRWLGAPYEAVANSVAVLQDAHELELLNLIGGPFDDDSGPGSPADVALFDWLAQHPPLRRIQCDSWSEAQVAQLASRRPGLRVNRGDWF